MSTVGASYGIGRYALYASTIGCFGVYAKSFSMLAAGNCRSLLQSAGTKTIGLGHSARTFFAAGTSAARWSEITRYLTLCSIQSFAPARLRASARFVAGPARMTMQLPSCCAVRALRTTALTIAVSLSFFIVFGY